MANSIDGRVVDATSRLPVAQVTVEAISTGQTVGSAISNADGVFSIPVDPRRFKALVESGADVGFGVAGPNLQPYTVTGKAVWNGRLADERVTVVVRPTASDPGATFSVQGVVTDVAGVAAVGLGVEAWDLAVAGQNRIATEETGSDGRYVMTYSEGDLGGKAAADLQVRVVAPGRDEPLVASTILFVAPAQATVDLVVQRAEVPQQPEYARLLASTAPYLGDRGLADIDADGVTYLAGRTGWDARTVAMAAQAAQLSAQTQIPSEHYYALLRTGLPGDPTEIHRLDDDALIGGLKDAIESGIIADQGDLEQTLRLHQAAAAEALRAFRPSGMVSTLGDIMALRLNAEQQASFLDVYRSASGDPAALWTSLAQRGFDETTITGLQTDAVFGEITRQNAPVVGRLTNQLGVAAPEELADRGLYRPEAWQDLVANDVPDGMTADIYAAGLAAQVANRFPARVTADMVRTGAVDVGEHSTAEVANFFAAHGEAVSIGVAPVHTWDGFANLGQPARDGAQLVERLYQMSPSNASMTALSKIGIGSARDVMRYSPDSFVAKFGDSFPSTLEARLTYQKAQEVHTTALTVATTYLAYRQAPNVYAISGELARQAPVPDPTIAASATLEDLFGSMDYCSCDHCRSVLSPAAYLVELLEFIDVGDAVHTLGNPLDVLLARRPDLQHIALSCENTNTALPYVDLVLEILEHWVVNGSLATFAGHDTPADAQTADLLADPEYVIDSAYDTTKAAVYPFGLPFDAPLDQLRRLFEVWDSSLPEALDVLGNPADARREWLQLNGPERSILTDITFRALPEYFGEPPATSIDGLNSVVGNAKTFCRRTGIAYTELADILSSRFVNPGVVLISLLEALQVSLHQIQQRFDGDLTDQAFSDLLPADLDPAPYGGDVLAWLDANRALIMGLITLTDMTPADDESHECDFGMVELRFALPDPDANRLTEIAFDRLHRFLRLWKKLGWSITMTDDAITAFLGADPAALTTGTIDAAFTALLDRLAGFVRQTTRLGASEKQLAAWLALFDPALDTATRQDRLAALLRVGTIDLAHLLEITGIDPFADDLGSDTPSLTQLVDAVALLKASPLKVVDVDYLLRHDDLTGKLTPSTATLRHDLKALRDALTAVDTELAVPVATADLGAAAAKMALVYDAGVVDRFLALVAGTTTYAVPLTTVEEILPTTLTALAPGIRIDPFHNTLTSTGLLSAATTATLDAATDALVLADVEQIDQQADLDTFKVNVKTGLQALQDAADADLAALNADYPELKALYDSLAGVTDPAAQAAAIAAGILPELRATLRATALRTGLANATKSDVEVIDALVTGAAVLHADADTTAGVLADFFGLETAAALDADGTLELLLDPLASDDYLLYVAAPTGTQVTLVVDGTTAIPTTATDADGELRSVTPLTFSAGTLVPVSLTLAGLPGGAQAALRWRTKAIAKSPVPASRLYVADALDRAQRSLIRVEKVLLLVKSLGLTPGELRDLGAVRTDTAGIWNAIDSDATITPADLHAQWQRLAWLLWFTALKADHEPEDDTFLAILRDPAAVNARGQLVVAGVMEWVEADLTAVLTALGLTTTDLGELRHLRRVEAALDLVAATLQPASDLVTWAVADPDGTLVRQLRETLRGRMDIAAWQESMKSVTDQVRNAHRDALVAYILKHAVPSPEIETADQLYEYFLVDVAMDACMETSRIVLALSTVQLFVNRCLLNLEPQVSPDSIAADHWSWMRRYRVWEANRKVFLFPENWLEPELRDDKSPFFRDLESELLKSDITTDLAETAYLHYLQKLDDVARLEIAGAYLEPRTAGTTDDDVLHVIGRTQGSTREHWYRRYEYGYWTPWEKVSLNIEGDIVVPLIWKKRLFVFWMTTVVQAQGDSSKTPQDLSDDPWATAARVDATVTVHRGEYYHGAWSSPKTTETTTSLTWGSLPSFDAGNIRVETQTYVPASSPGGPPLSERLVLRIGYHDGAAMGAYILTFTSTNSSPMVTEEDPFWVYLGYNALMLELGRTPKPPVDANSWVYPDKQFSVRVAQPSEPKTPIAMNVLTKTDNLLDGFRVRPVLHDGANPWELPLFYTDERSVFFVTGDEQQYSEFPHYYADDVVLNAAALQRAPLVREEPVKSVIPKPDDPVINPQWAVQLPGNATFEFAGATFDAGGAVAESRQFNA
jgi:Neuraminidase-like domain